MTSRWMVCAFALLLGCSEDGGMAGGSAGTGGNGGRGMIACVEDVCPCTEAGIRAAIAEGGGPFTFDCDGPTTIETEAEIVIDNDVILDGEENLTVEAAPAWSIFSVPEGVTLGLRRLAMSRGVGAVRNSGTVSMTSVTVSDVICGGKVCIDGAIRNEAIGTLVLTNSTVSRNEVGIFNEGSMTVTNTTVSQNESAAIWDGGTMILIHSTISGKIWLSSPYTDPGTVTLTSSLVNGDCVWFSGGETISEGGNLESPGNTCGFDQPTDLANVSAEDLKLGPLAYNAGPTMTHALGGDSVAIDHTPAVDCGVTTDQRGQPRPETGGTMCDVGAFEVQP